LQYIFFRYTTKVVSFKKKKKHSTRKTDYEDDLPINYNEKMFKNYIEKLAAITDEYCNRKETRKNTNTQNSLHL
jgi:hypothetical protein